MSEMHKPTSDKKDYVNSQPQKLATYAIGPCVGLCTELEVEGTDLRGETKFLRSDLEKLPLMHWPLTDLDRFFDELEVLVLHEGREQ